MDTVNGPSKLERRAVSFFIWDPELEHKIEREVKMIDGISKLLNVATKHEQTIECHKSLVLSQQRILAYMAEIQRKQNNLLQRDDTNLQPTKASVTLSDIRIPLLWENMKGKSEQKKFAIFALVRIGCEIIDTRMNYIDIESTEIVFTDKITFDNVSHNFELHLEIYALNRSLALSSSAKDFANRYSYFSVHGSPKTARRNQITNLTDHKISNQEQSKFVLIARAIFTKDSIDKMAIGRDLKMEHRQENPLMQLPIHTSFISRFIAQPYCYTRLAMFVGIAENCNIRYSCVLAGGFMNGEEIVDDDFSDQHRFTIPIESFTIISSNENRLSFGIHNPGFKDEMFIVTDRHRLNNWIRALKQHIVDITVWETTYKHLPTTRRSSYQSIVIPLTPSMSGKTFRKKGTSKTKSRSMENLWKANLLTSSVTNIDNSSKANRNDDDDNSVYQTRL